jgi:glucose-1-phosphate thymidylyltransferase
VKAYLLAAGYATRMFPLTRDIPKPLLEVAGAPILTHMVARVLALPDVREIVVIANARFQDAFQRWAEALELERPVAIRVLDDGSMSDDDKLGAVGDLAFALAASPPDGDWLVAAGDNLLEFGLSGLYEAYRARGDALLAVRPVARDGPSAYNEVTLGPEDLVAEFREKPDDPRSELAAIALYFFPQRVASSLTQYLAQGGNRDAPGHFIAWLVAETVVRAAPIPGTWFDIGSLEGLAIARDRFRPPSDSTRRVKSPG